MSVIKSKRTLSKCDYYYKFNTLYDFYINEFAKMPIRKREYIAGKISVPMTEAARNVHCLYDIFWQKQHPEINQKDLIHNIADNLYKLSKPLIAAANAEAFPAKRLDQWKIHIDDVIKDMNETFDENLDLFNVYQANKDKDVKFVTTMKQLHSFTYSKMTRLPKKYHDTLGTELTSLVDDALFNVMAGNSIFPKTNEDIEQRHMYFSSAIEALNRLQSPLYSYTNLRFLPEKEIKAWTWMLGEEIKLLQGINHSDKKRKVD